MNVLVVAVHPDDETLGCGGTLLKMAAAGDRLHWLVLTAATPPSYSEPQAAQQEHQLRAVEDAYPFDSCEWLKLPTTRLEQVPFNDVIRRIRDVTVRVRPDTVFLPSRSDVHSDHRVAFDASMSVLKGFYLGALGVRRILACEVPSETDASPPIFVPPFVPNVFVDVSATLERKLEIFRLYESEVQPEPLPRTLSALRGLARHRGATVGVEYAEAFTLVRQVL